MVSKAKTFFHRIMGSSIGKNVISLYALQFANYIFPLITVPYLVRVLGPEKFGTVTFAQGLIAYFNLFVEYGFNWSATRKISVQRHDLEAVIRTANSVWVAKGLLCGFGLLVLLILVNVIPELIEVSSILLILYGTVMGSVLFPTWLFQGLEHMVLISIINSVVRTLFTVGVFLLVRQSSDFLTYVGLLSFQSIGSGIIAVIVAYRDLGLRFMLPSWSNVKSTLIDGWVLFLSQGVVSLYTAGNAFILGLFVNSTIVGYYSAADRLINAAKRLLAPISSAVFPRFSEVASRSKRDLLRWARKGLVLQGSIGLFLSFIVFIGAPTIVRIMLGPDYKPSVSVMRILAPLPLLIGIGSSFGQFVIMPLRRDSVRFLTLLGAGIINVMLAYALVPRWSANGMALGVLISEVFVTLVFFVYSEMKGLSLIHEGA